MTRKQRIAQLREFKLKIASEIKEMGKVLSALESAERKAEQRDARKHAKGAENGDKNISTLSRILQK